MGVGAANRMLYFSPKPMIFSKDYVGYLARQTVKHLVEQKMIQTDKAAMRCMSG